MEDITKVSTVELVKQLTELEQKIDLLILKYNYITKELCRRYPSLKKEDEFKPKVLTKGKIDI